MNETLVSVIIPVYNRAEKVCQAVESVLGQSYANLEVIVVDDGSTDDTLYRLEKYKGLIKIISQKNSGPSTARNRGISRARGEIVMFLDSDDLWLEDKVTLQVGLMEKLGAQVPCCICNAYLSNPIKNKRTSFELAGLWPEQKSGLWMNVTEILFTRCLYFTQAVAIRRNVLDKIGGFNPKLRWLEDYEMALRVSLEGPWGFIDEPLVIYKRNPGDSMSVRGRSNPGELYKCIEKILTGFLYDERLEKHIERKYLVSELNRIRRLENIFQSKVNGSLQHLFRNIERMRRAAYIRSSKFPRMRTFNFIPRSQICSLK